MKGITITPAALGALLNRDIKNFEIASTPGGIERQEAEGQKSMASSSLLPIEMGYGGDASSKYKELGIEVASKHDDLFYKVVLPEGWRIVPTNHSMWSTLVDSTGKEVADIFYKAAFYDRRADISFKP